MPLWYVQLDWTPVTEDTFGNSISVDYYIIYRSSEPYFAKAKDDSIGTVVTPPFTDVDILLTNDKCFYYVTAVKDYGDEILNKSKIINLQKKSKVIIINKDNSRIGKR